MFHLYNQEGNCHYCGTSEDYPGKSFCPGPVKDERAEEISRPCACGSGNPWQNCQGNPEKETPWEFCG